MKKIIDGKTYNTETAEEIGSYDNGLGARDFRHCKESLYKTKRGPGSLQGKVGLCRTGANQTEMAHGGVLELRY